MLFNSLPFPRVAFDTKKWSVIGWKGRITKVDEVLTMLSDRVALPRKGGSD